MKRKRKKKNLKEKDDYFYEEEDQDGEFYYIAGYTSNGAPFGITWEEALMDGIIDAEEYRKRNGENEEDIF